MAEILINPSIAKLSPGLASSIQKANLPKPQIQMVEQMAQSFTKAKDLLKISEDKAREEFLKLDPIVQNNIRYIYPTQKRFEAEQSLLGKIAQGVGKAASTATSNLFTPLVAAFKAVDILSKVGATGPNVYQQVKYGKKPFTKKVLTDSYNGINMWRADDVAIYEQKYGKALVTLARGLAEMKTPGEAVDSYAGGFDEDMTAAFIFMADNPDKFGNILEEIKQGSQLSPGRNLGQTQQFITGDPNNWAVKFVKKFAGIDVATQEGQAKASKIVSGPIDAAYRLLNPFDALNWIGAGPAIKAATKGVDGIKVNLVDAVKFGGFKNRGERLAQQYKFIAERGGPTGIKDATRFTFSQPDIIALWDKGMGPIIQRYGWAKPGAEKAAIYRQISNDYPEWANEGVVRDMAKSGVEDAKTAQKFFQEFDNGKALLGLRVDGTDFYRYGIPVARKTRVYTAAVHKTIADTFYGNSKTKEDFAKIDKIASDTIEKLKRVADKKDSLLSPELDEILALNKESTTMLNNIARLGSRKPGRILYGDDAIKTIDEVRHLAVSIGFKKEIAEVIAQEYVDSTVDYQITMIRNLYASFYKKIGMGGSVNGEAHMAELLNSTFNEKAGMFTMARTEIPQGWETALNRSIYHYDNDVPILAGRGIVHPSQIAMGIAPINYDLAYEYAAMSKLNSKEIATWFGGATRNQYITKFTNFWANLTLFPRLGTRSSVDETVFYGLNAPFLDLLQLATTSISPIGAEIRAATAITGSKSGIGMYKRGLFKTFPHLDTTKAIPVKTRKKIITDLAELHEVPVGNVLHAEIMENTVNRAIEIYGKTMPEGTFDALKLAMKHSPTMIDSIANSVSAKASLSSKIDIDYLDSTFMPSSWTNFLKEMGLEKSKKWTSYQVSKLSEKEVASIQNDNFQRLFGYNSQKITEQIYINPTPHFFINNGLRNLSDFTKARDAMLADIGIVYDTTNGIFVSRGAKNYANRFISPYGITVYYRQQGNTDIEIARAIIENMLIDMKTAFHGSTNGFNEDLYKLISKKQAEIQKAAEETKMAPFDTWSKAIEVTTFKEFEDATVGMRPTSGEINTSLVSVGGNKDLKSLEEFDGIGGFIERFQNWSMEVMDAQTTGLYRQKMLWITLERNLKELKPFEANLKADHLAAMLKQNPNADANFIARMDKNATALAEKQYVELALADAQNTLLKFVDNPAVRSNLATSARSVGRFYRATEDFYRRIYRLSKNNPLRVLYRMRLLSTGLAASGDVYTDANEDQYIIFPTDAVVNNVLEPALRLITGNNKFKVPVFNDIALKLRLINPSFSPDAGQPSLSSPIAAVSMLAIKGMLNNLYFLPDSVKEFIEPTTTKISDAIDTIALGHIGASLDLYEALMPMFTGTIFSTLSSVEKDRQKSTAALQAISYLAAYGNVAPKREDFIKNKTGFVEAQEKYLSNIRIAVWSIVGFRNLLGQISPGQPSLKETATLPKYLKRVGMGSPSAAFWDIYNSILRNGDADSTNSWDLALATFVGKNPGKLAFIEPRNEKEYKVFINKTDNVKTWAIDNRKFIETYNEIAWLFAPKIGEYNPDIYGWMQAQNLVSVPTMEKYLRQVQLATDKDKYFKISDKETEQLSSINDIDRRRMIMANADKAREAMRISSPSLAAELESGLIGRGALMEKFSVLSEAVYSPKAPISKQLRATFMFVVEEVNTFVNFTQSGDNRGMYDYVNIKEVKKNELQMKIDEIAKSVPEIAEASRLIFTPYLNTYSREVTSAGGK